MLWILDKATFTVAPDPGGKGAMDGSAATAGLARAEHYVKLSKDARINSDGRAIQGDEITITLTSDDERVQMMQLRGNSRITGGAGGPQSMTARDIDLIYGTDGRTLQNANLVEQAVVDLGRRRGGQENRGEDDQHRHGARRDDRHTSHRERDRPGGHPARERRAGKTDPLVGAGGQRRARFGAAERNIHRQGRVPRDPGQRRATSPLSTGR